MITTDWRPRPDQITRYTEGDCWLLAFQLGGILNAPVTALCAAEDPADWLHVAVDLGRERLLDVTGLHYREDMRANWAERSRGPVVFRELGFFHSIDEYLIALDGTHLGWYISLTDEDQARTTAHAIARSVRGEQHGGDNATDDSDGEDDDSDDHLLCWSGRRWKELLDA